MDALDLLTADHNRVRGLFARFKEAQEADDTATMGTLADEGATITNTAMADQIKALIATGISKRPRSNAPSTRSNPLRTHR